MIQTVRTMAETAAGILHPKLHSVWLYGSVVLDDFRQGWSDIDFLAFSNAPIAAEQAQRLLYLRAGTFLALPG
jgi:Nucleotidyltransferase domain.